MYHLAYSLRPYSFVAIPYNFIAMIMHDWIGFLSWKWCIVVLLMHGCDHDPIRT